MYFEEQIVNGVLCHRNNPKAQWIPYTLEEMAQKWKALKEDNEVFQSALQKYGY